MRLFARVLFSSALFTLSVLSVRAHAAEETPIDVETDKPIAAETPKAPGKAELKPLSGICRDLCGDGSCQEIVCQSEGCPCEESSSSCPQDCV